MGLLEKLFPHKRPGKDREPREYFKTLTAYQSVYTTYRGGLYEMELTRAAIAAFAWHCSKLHLEITGDVHPELAAVLSNQPNPWMDASKFIARLATIYQIQNNAFIVPMEDDFGRLTGSYPVLPQQAEVMDYGGVTYLRYHFWGGQTAAVELSHVGFLTQHQYEDDFFGETNRPLYSTMQMMQTQNEGIVNGIKNATTIRFLARLSNTLKAKDIEAERKRFARDNLQENDTGVLMFDQKYAEVKQIESTPLVVNPKQQELIRQNVFEYFGTNEKILTNNYGEDEWNAYYEGMIEPFAIQLSHVLTAAAFDVDFERCKSLDRSLNMDESRLYPNYQTMFAEEAKRPDGIEAVDVATPNFLHYEATKAALEAGLHVICEKPLFFEVEQGEEIKRLAEEKGKIVCVTYGFSGFDMLQQMRAMVTGGTLGKINMIELRYAHGFGCDPEADVKSEGQKWRVNPAKVGRAFVLGDLSTHTYYISQLICPDQKLKQVLCDRQSFVSSCAPLEDNAYVLMRYEDGTVGRMWCSCVNAGDMSSQTIRIVGSKASIEWNDARPDLVKYQVQGQPEQILYRGMDYLAPPHRKMSVSARCTTPG